MKSYQELLAERAVILEKIAQAKIEARACALVTVRELVGEFQITPQELYPRPPKKASVARYRHPESGETWSGRGRPPAWIAGKDRARFEIDQHDGQC